MASLAKAAVVGLGFGAGAAEATANIPTAPMEPAAIRAKMDTIPAGATPHIMPHLDGLKQVSFLQPPQKEKSAADLKVEAAELELKKAKEPYEKFLKAKDIAKPANDAEKDLKEASTLFAKVVSAENAVVTAQAAIPKNTRDLPVPELVKRQKAVDQAGKSVTAAEKALEDAFPGQLDRVKEMRRDITQAERMVREAKAERLKQ